MTGRGKAPRAKISVRAPQRSGPLSRDQAQAFTGDLGLSGNRV